MTKRFRHAKDEFGFSGSNDFAQKRRNSITFSLESLIIQTIITIYRMESIMMFLIYYEGFFLLKLLTHNNVILWFLLMERREGWGPRYGSITLAVNGLATRGVIPARVGILMYKYLL